MQNLLANWVHVPLIYLAGMHVFKSATMALCAALPYFAFELAASNNNNNQYALLSTLALACAAIVGSFVVNKPPTIFELLGVIPDLRSSLPLRIQINKLVNTRSTPPPVELIQAAKRLVNDAERRRYMVYGPSMQANDEETLLWYLVAFLFMCSIASRKGCGAGTLLFGCVLLFITCALEMVETNSPQPAIRLNAFPLLCTFELMQGLRIVAVCIFSTVVYFTRANHVDHIEHALESLDRVIKVNDAALKEVKE